MVHAYGYKELKADLQLRDALKKKIMLEPTSVHHWLRLHYYVCLSLCLCMQLQNVQPRELTRNDRKRKAYILHALERCGDLPDLPVCPIEPAYMKKKQASTKSNMLAPGVAYAWFIFGIIIPCIVNCSGPLSTFDWSVLLPYTAAYAAATIAYVLLGVLFVPLVELFIITWMNSRFFDWSVLQPEALLPYLAPRTRTKCHIECHSRPDMALDSSERGDTAIVDAYGVVSQPKLSMVKYGYVETPIQQPQGRPLSSSGEPEHTDIDSTSTTASTNKPCWLLASSAPCHMASDASLMTDYTPTHEDDDNHFVTVPNMGDMRVHGTGSVRTATVCLDGVKHVPGLGSKNLVSTGQLARGGYTVTLAPSGCRITARGNDHTVVVGEAHFTEESLFQVDFLTVLSTSAE